MFARPALRHWPTLAGRLALLTRHHIAYSNQVRPWLQWQIGIADSLDTAPSTRFCAPHRWSPLAASTGAADRRAASVLATGDSKQGTIAAHCAGAPNWEDRWPIDARADAEAPLIS